jgi:hypothetical protein
MEAPVRFELVATHSILPARIQLSFMIREVLARLRHVPAPACPPFNDGGRSYPRGDEQERPPDPVTVPIHG